MGTWNNTDGLYLKYGVTKAVPTTGGDFLSYGSLRVIELKIADMSTLTSTAAIINDVTIMPINCIIEQVETVADTACTSSGSGTLNVGLMKFDRTTSISDTGILAAQAFSTLDGTGEKTTSTSGSTYAGTKVGTVIGSDPAYFTAKYATAAFQTGAVTIKIFYRGTGTITQ